MVKISHEEKKIQSIEVSYVSDASYPKHGQIVIKRKIKPKRRSEGGKVNYMVKRKTAFCTLENEKTV